MNDLYQEIILDHNAHPHNQGVFPLGIQVHTVSEKNVGCGDEITVSIIFDDTKTQIKEIRWQGVGCAISTAAMSVLSDNVKGKTVDEVLAYTRDDILELIGLEEIVTGREKCLMLGLRAIQRVIEHRDTSE